MFNKSKLGSSEKPRPLYLSIDTERNTIGKKGFFMIARKFPEALLRCEAQYKPTRKRKKKTMKWLPIFLDNKLFLIHVDINKCHHLSISQYSVPTYDAVFCFFLSCYKISTSFYYSCWWGKLVSWTVLPSLFYSSLLSQEN